jgi:hypothetical protein
VINKLNKPDNAPADVSMIAEESDEDLSKKNMMEVKGDVSSLE